MQTKGVHPRRVPVGVLLQALKELAAFIAKIAILVKACERFSAYQTSHRSAGARTIAESFLQPNASAKAGKFESGPMTRYLAIG